MSFFVMDFGTKATLCVTFRNYDLCSESVVYRRIRSFSDITEDQKTIIVMIVKHKIDNSRNIE